MTRLPRLLPRLLALSCAATALACAAADAPEGARLAAEMGCLNCHAAHAAGSEAPAFKAMAERARQRGGAPDAVADHWLEEMHEKDRIHTHTMVSTRRARAVLGWVAQGGQ